MASMEYDVDSMGGLMPQILALTAPPGSRDLNKQQGSGIEAPKKEGLAAHPYFRRPGRGHNHDSCDACGEGGDLICCDLCPASFHLTCHDPPLEEEDIPMGQWACHQCKFAGPDDDRTSVSSGKSNKSAKGVKRKEKDDDRSLTSNTSNEKKVCAGGREFEISDSPLATLIKAAAIVNPKQFSLPYEMTLPVCFPGEPKTTNGKSNGKGKNSVKKKSYELDNGLVPLPAKLCFQCNKSCRVGPLVPCDYCQLFFHLDCLDPPLTTPPMGKWMCPNHPEHFVDSTLLTSHSLSERVKLWDKFTQPVDQDSVRLNFLRRVHRQNPPFRYKVKRALRSRIKVPLGVKEHYMDPPDLLLRHAPPQHLLPYRVENEIGASSTATGTLVPGSSPMVSSSTTIPTGLPNDNSQMPEVKEEPLEESEFTQDVKEEPAREAKIEDKRKELERKRPTKEEVDQWLAGLLCLQASIIKHMANNTTSGSKTPDKQRELNGPPLIGSSADTSPPIERQGCMNGDLTFHDLNIKHPRYTDNRKPQPIINSNFQPPPSFLPAKKGILKNQKTNRNTSNTTVKAPRQRKQTASEILSETLASLASSLQNSITGKQEVSLSQLERSVVEVLAWQRLEELLCPPRPAATAVTTDPLPARALLCPLVPDSHLRDWAVKHPTPSYSSQPVAMTYRIIRIGKGSHNHVDLSTYGHCNYISQEHAAIFYDENTGHYELLNYSPHGTRVDSVLYKYDHSEKTVNHAPQPPLLQQVRAIIDHRRGQLSERTPEEYMTDTPGQTLTHCGCKLGKLKGNSTLKPSTNLGCGGWEGGAVLHHGSHLRFGCLQFVFSIVEEASKADWIETTLSIYDKFFKQEEEEEEEKKKKEKGKEKKEEEEDGKDNKDEDDDENGDENDKSKKEDRNSNS